VIDQFPCPVLIAHVGAPDLKWNRAAANARAALAADGRESAVVLDVRLPTGERVPGPDLPLTRALEQGETTTGAELALATRDGRSLPVIASAAPLREADGRIRGAVAVFEDISVMKQLERTREEWTAVIAHDLRQPLNGIVLQTDVLRRGLRASATEAQLSSLGHIKDAAMRLNRMIEDLLDATRIETSRLRLERRATALPPLVHDILTRTAELSGREILFHADGEIPDVLADSERVEQVISNLVSNAAKYGEPGTAIDVRIERLDAGVRVSVTNEGREIDADEVSKLFTRFFRTRSAEAGPKRGIGLGLYICKGLVEAHGGRIGVESRDGRTTFHFTLPASDEGAAGRS
jgi:signal transduction histidine kinase